MNEPKQSPEDTAADMERAAWFARLAFGCWDPRLPAPAPQKGASAYDVMP